MPTFREPCSSLYQSEEQPDTELFFRVAPFYILRYLWNDGGEKKELGGGRRVEEIGQSALTGRIVFHILFML